MTTETRTATFLNVTGRDDWSESTLDRLEITAGGTIAYRREDGRGGMVYSIRPRIRLTIADRKRIIEGVRPFGPARWVTAGTI